MAFEYKTQIQQNFKDRFRAVHVVYLNENKNIQTLKMHVETENDDTFYFVCQFPERAFILDVQIDNENINFLSSPFMSQFSIVELYFYNKSIAGSAELFRLDNQHFRPSGSIYAFEFEDFV